MYIHVPNKFTTILSIIPTCISVVIVIVLTSNAVDSSYGQIKPKTEIGIVASPLSTKV
jgi:hypothetical protein